MSHGGSYGRPPARASSLSRLPSSLPAPWEAAPSSPTCAFAAGRLWRALQPRWPVCRAADVYTWVGWPRYGAGGQGREYGCVCVPWVPTAGQRPGAALGQGCYRQTLALPGSSSSSVAMVPALVCPEAGNRNDTRTNPHGGRPISCCFGHHRGLGARGWEWHSQVARHPVRPPTSVTKLHSRSPDE